MNKLTTDRIKALEAAVVELAAKHGVEMTFIAVPKGARGTESIDIESGIVVGAVMDEEERVSTLAGTLFVHALSRFAFSASRLTLKSLGLPCLCTIDEFDVPQSDVLLN